MGKKQKKQHMLAITSSKINQLLIHLPLSYQAHTVGFCKNMRQAKNDDDNNKNIKSSHSENTAMTSRTKEFRKIKK